MTFLLDILGFALLVILVAIVAWGFRRLLKKGPPDTAARVGLVRKRHAWITFERVFIVLNTVVIMSGIWVAVGQLEKLRLSIDLSTWSSISGNLTEVDKQFIDHPEMVPYFYDGVAVENGHKDYLRAYSLAVLIIDFMDSAIVMGEQIDPEIFEPDIWEQYYEYQFTSSPIICAVILDEADIYGTDIVSKGHKYCPPQAEGPRASPRPRPPVPVQ